MVSHCWYPVNLIYRMSFCSSSVKKEKGTNRCQLRLTFMSLQLPRQKDHTFPTEPESSWEGSFDKSEAVMFLFDSMVHCTLKALQEKVADFLTWTCIETPWCFCRFLSGQRWNTQEEVRSSGGHRIGGCVHFHVLRPNKRSAKIVDRYSEYRDAF